MNGFDHLPPDTTTGAIAAAIGARPRAARRRGRRAARRDRRCPSATARSPARASTNLLPGVWSARMPLKLRNRAVETLLTAWAEPWAAFGHAARAPRRAARARSARGARCLQNQAHDSIGGCSVDRGARAHGRALRRRRRSRARHRRRACSNGSRAANRVRDTPWREAQDVVVFNASADSRAPTSCGCRSRVRRRGG